MGFVTKHFSKIGMLALGLAVGALAESQFGLAAKLRAKVGV